MPTGGTRATGRGWVGGVCFAYFQPGVRKALTESPVVCWGSELGFLMTTLRNMFSFASSPAMLWLLGWIPIDVEDKEKSHHSASIPVWRRWISKATKVADIWYLYICYSTFRHVDNNQLLSNAPWLSCSIHPKPIIMPIHGDDKETCVCVCGVWLSSSWWSDGWSHNYAVWLQKICWGIKLQSASQTRYPLTSSCSSQ